MVTWQSNVWMKIRSLGWDHVAAGDDGDGASHQIGLFNDMA